MALQYYLVENHLTANPNDYAANTVNVRSYTLEEIIDRISKKGMTLTKVDISAVLQAYHEEIASIIEDGGRLNTPLFNSQPSIKGVFTNINDSFDSTRHSIHTKPSVGVVMRDATAKISVQKVNPPATGTRITSVIDKASNTTNTQLTANAPIEITGHKIKLTGEAAVGAYFIATNGTEQKATLIITNEPSKLILMTPALAIGTYTLEIRTHFSGGGKPLKHLRVARFEQELTVA